MGKAPKSVRKFSKKHLKSSIAHRRKLQPMKNALRRKDAALEEKRWKLSNAQANENAANKKKVEDMNVDELMSGDFLVDDENFDKDSEGEAVSDSDVSLPDDEEDEEEEETDFIDITPADMDDASESDDEEDESGIKKENRRFKSAIQNHKKELEELKEKDPEFYHYLKQHDEELLDFDAPAAADDDDDEEEAPASKKKKKTNEEVEAPASEEEKKKKKKTNKEVEAAATLTTAQVDAWCKAVKEKQQFSAVKNLLTAFRSACHYGEGENDEEVHSKFSITNSSVFNKVMVFVLTEIDGVFRKILQMTDGGDKSITPQDLQSNGRWKKMFPYVKSYLGNALHILNQMTDSKMISFTLRRLKSSIVFLGALPSLCRKYVKAALHFWGTGEGALPVVAFTFVRDVAMQLGSEYLDICLKGIYKQYAASTKFVNAASLPRAQLLANCVVELYGIDMAASYQNAFGFIRQMAIILRNALTVKTKDAFRKVYCWQYVACLQLWVKVVGAYCGSKDDLQPLAYPMAQILGGVARLLPTARYIPLRLQCAILLNRLAASTGAFFPIASLLLDMLSFKELRKKPTGGVGKAADFMFVLKVQKQSLKTRAFQEECVNTVLEQLGEHVAQWSYAISFAEFAVVPLLQLRRFMKETNVDRFRRLAKQLIDEIERNVEFVKKKRDEVSFSPKDSAAVNAFLAEEKANGVSPLTHYCKLLQQRAKDRRTSVHGSSVEIKEKVNRAEEDDDDGDGDGDGEGDDAPKMFNKDFLREKRDLKKKKKEADEGEGGGEGEEDVVEELMLSSDDEGEDEGDGDGDGEDEFDGSEGEGEGEGDESEEEIEKKKKIMKKKKGKQMNNMKTKKMLNKRKAAAAVAAGGGRKKRKTQ